MIGKQVSHYEVEALIGRGGMGVVYRARDVRLGRPVALKVLKETVVHDEDKKRRFLQEARSASAVSHPSIASVYDVDEVDGQLFIALEFVEGETVRSLIQKRELDLMGAIEVAIQTAEGLGQAHAKGIVHRDIKSDNIIVTPTGHAKILDFGLAKLLDPSSGEGHTSIMETMAQTQAGTVLGTVAYMSPEQARGKDVDHRSDIFSLGVVIYEMVTSEMPFRGYSPLDTMHAIAFEEVRPVTVVRKDLPADLQRILSRCLRKRKEDRYQSAEELIRDLKRLKHTLETGSQPALTLRDRLYSFTEWARFSTPSGLLGTAGLVLIGGLLGWLFFAEERLGSLILALILLLPLYRFIRNRKARMLRRIVSKVSKQPEVRAVLVTGDLMTVVSDDAKAHFYIKVNSLVETANRKLFYGDPIQVAIRTNPSDEEMTALLSEPGVRYLRADAPRPGTFPSRV